MLKQIKIQINNKEYSAQAGDTVLDVARKNGLKIPALCYHPDLQVQGMCRLCLVELENGQLVTSCTEKVREGLKIKLNTPAVRRARKTNLELIFASHEEKCGSCILNKNCALQKLARDFKIERSRFQERKDDRAEIQFGDAIFIDQSKCIECGNCIEVCRQQECNFLEKVGASTKTRVQPTDDFTKDCIYCGQCVVHCPVGAIHGLPHWEPVEELLQKKNNKVLIAQIAPSIRVSIGEEFKMDYGEVVTGQLATAMRAVGFDYAFDVSTGADFTTYEEARELIHWILNKKDIPMFTSCCPGWVKFARFYYPEFISHLTSTDSPHIISGTLAKTYFADKINRDPRDIVVTSIMPCTAKKHEINLESHYLDLKKKIKSVDYVLTTREFAYLLRRHKIDFKKLKSEKMDDALGVSSGAGNIYGASGGVMESALRTADYFLRVYKETGSFKSILNGENYKLKKEKFSKIAQSRIEFKEVRGQQGIKDAIVRIGNRKLKIAVVNGTGNAKKILENLKRKRCYYDYVEVMACPGGCIGGGGQPVPTNSEIRRKRADALYQIDENLKIKTAHENPEVLDVYKNYFRGDEELMERLMHSGFEEAMRGGYKKIK